MKSMLIFLKAVSKSPLSKKTNFLLFNNVKVYRANILVVSLLTLFKTNARYPYFISHLEYTLASSISYLVR